MWAHSRPKPAAHRDNTPHIDPSNTPHFAGSPRTAVFLSALDPAGRVTDGWKRWRRAHLGRNRVGGGSAGDKREFGDMDSGRKHVGRSGGGYRRRRSGVFPAGQCGTCRARLRDNQNERHSRKQYFNTKGWRRYGCCVFGILRRIAIRRHRRRTTNNMADNRTASKGGSCRRRKQD